MCRPRRAFTLVELLIVIGIIAALIAILLPAVNRAREQSRRVVCLSNVRQITMAWITYVNDNKGQLCTDAFNRNWLLGIGSKEQEDEILRGTWTDPKPFMRNGTLWPYLRDFAVYVCPNDPQTYRVTSLGLKPGATGTSYVLQGRLAGWPIELPKPPFVRDLMFYTLTQVKRPSSTMVFLEQSNNTFSAGQTFFPPVYPNPWNGGGVGKIHLQGSRPEGCTVSFVDGHAVFWTYASEIDAEVARRQGPDVSQLMAWSGGPIPPGVVP